MLVPADHDFQRDSGDENFRKERDLPSISKISVQCGVCMLNFLNHPWRYPHVTLTCNVHVANLRFQFQLVKRQNGEFFKYLRLGGRVNNEIKKMFTGVRNSVGLGPYRNSPWGYDRTKMTCHCEILLYLNKILFNIAAWCPTRLLR